MLTKTKTTITILTTGFITLSSGIANAGVYEWIQWSLGIEVPDTKQDLQDLMGHLAIQKADWDADKLRKQKADEELRKQKAEEELRKQKAEEELRKQKAEEKLRKKMAEEKIRKQKAEEFALKQETLSSLLSKRPDKESIPYFSSGNSTAKNNSTEIILASIDAAHYRGTNQEEIAKRYQRMDRAICKHAGVEYKAPTRTTKLSSIPLPTEERDILEVPRLDIKNNRPDFDAASSVIFVEYQDVSTVPVYSRPSDVSVYLQYLNDWQKWVESYNSLIVQLDEIDEDSFSESMRDVLKIYLDLSSMIETNKAFYSFDKSNLLKNVEKISKLYESEVEIKSSHQTTIFDALEAMEDAAGEIIFRYSEETESRYFEGLGKTLRNDAILAAVDAAKYGDLKNDFGGYYKHMDQTAHNVSIHRNLPIIEIFEI